MSDFFSIAVEVQKEIIRAQQAQLDAAQAMLDGGLDAEAKVAEAKRAATKVAEANARAWTAWANLWGWM